MMRRTRLGVLRSLCLGAILACGSTALAQEPSADDLIKLYEAVEMPRYDRARATEEGYRDSYMKARREAEMAKADICRSFYEQFPKHDRAGELMDARWAILSRAQGPEAVIKECRDVLADKPGEPLAAHAHYRIASNQLSLCYQIQDEIERADKATAAAMTFMKAYPEDQRAPSLLYSSARSFVTDADQQRQMYEMILDKYASSREATRVKGKMRQLDGLGEPFELEFTDAVTGTEIKMEELEGKVVVIDFWATWCGPCIAEMPHLKELYAEYKGQGVEFIGISLDQPEASGGLDKLLAYCKDNEVTWPQYYQGNGWQSEFSSSWGIDAIPAMFVVAKDGTLASVSARGNLETIIPEELGK